MSHQLINTLRTSIPIDESMLFNSINKHLKTRNSPASNIELWIVGKNKMQSLNLKFMKKDKPTDVLSFPLDLIPGENVNDKALIGTIVVCSDIINLYAKENGTSFEFEIVRLINHGVDHLQGIHHK